MVTNKIRELHVSAGNDMVKFYERRISLLKKIQDIIANGVEVEGDMGPFSFKSTVFSDPMAWNSAEYLVHYTNGEPLAVQVYSREDSAYHVLTNDFETFNKISRHTYEVEK